jgi:hypothetical protein
LSPAPLGMAFNSVPLAALDGFSFGGEGASSPKGASAEPPALSGFAAVRVGARSVGDVAGVGSVLVAGVGSVLVGAVDDGAGLCCCAGAAALPGLPTSDGLSSARTDPDNAAHMPRAIQHPQGRIPYL